MGDDQKMANDLRTMPERISNVAASDLALLRRAADLIERLAAIIGQQKPRMCK